jgi:hypothetical protein
LTGTTSALGALTVSHTQYELGYLYAIQLVDGAADDGVDITLTAEHGNLSIPLFIKADFNTDQMVYPRGATAAITDGSALTDYAMPLVAGIPKMVIAQGGDAKVGVGCYLYIVEA